NSAEFTWTPSLFAGRKTQPKLLLRPLDQACTDAVTAVPMFPVAIGAAYCGLARYSSDWTPASPPKLFHVSVASDQLTVDSFISAFGATWPLVTSSQRVGDWIVDPSGICPAPAPKNPSKRIRPNSALGAG